MEDFKVGSDISEAAMETFKELADIENALHSSDAGRVLFETLGLLFAPRVSNSIPWGND